MSNNLNIIKRAIQSKNKNLDAQVEAFCIACANEAYSWLDTNKKEWMNRTYNLLDSTGIAVYKEGVLQGFTPLRPAQATEPRMITYHGIKKSVDGRALLSYAIGNYNSASLYYEFTLFSTADYARAVEEGGDSGTNSGKDWFKKLSDHLTDFKTKWQWN